MIDVLRDRTDNLDLRIEIIKSLESMHQAARQAAPTLMAIVADKTQPLGLRSVGVEGLQSIAPRVHPVLSELESIMESHEDVTLRVKAAQAIGSIGPDVEAVRKLAFILNDKGSDVELRRAAILSLLSQETSVAYASATLEAIFRDPTEDLELRRRAAQVLASRKIASDADLNTIVNILQNDREPNTLRDSAANYAGMLEGRASSVAPALAQLFADKTQDLLLRRMAVTALGMIRRNGRGVLTALEGIIRDKRSDYELRWRATWALGSIGAGDTSTDEEIIPVLVGVLNSSDGAQIRQYAVSFLASMNPGSSNLVQALTETAENSQEDSSIRQAVINALGMIGKNYGARKAEPGLANILHDQDAPLQLRQAAANSLGEFQPASTTTAHALIDVIANRKDDPRVRSSAAYALNVMALEEPFIATALGNILGDKLEDPAVREGAAAALGTQGKAAKQYFNVLLDSLDDPNPGIASAAATGLSRFAETLSDDGATDSVWMVKKSESALGKKINLANAGPEGGQSNIVVIHQARASLERQSRSETKEAVQDWVYKHRFTTGAFVFLGSWCFMCCLLLWLFPLLILGVSDWVSSLAGTTISLWKLSVPLEHFPIYPFRRYPRRALDRWVKRHAPTVRSNFERLQTVNERILRVDLPVRINGSYRQNLTPSDLVPIFKEERACVLISGEGGAGKTTLACQIGKWAIGDDSTDRICDHLTLPILIEGDVSFRAENSGTALVEISRGKLRDLIQKAEPPSAPLVKSLMRSRRILVIIDGYSEMRQQARNGLHVESPDFPVNALVVTSRFDEQMQATGQTLLVPEKLDLTALSSFVEEYLKRRQKLELFPGANFHELCLKLRATIYDRDITPLFAKLYIENAIQSKEIGKDFSIKPGDVPELILVYLNNLNRSITEDRLEDWDVHRSPKLLHGNA